MSGATNVAAQPRFIMLLCAASAAPLFWLGQALLGYAVTAHGCYPGDAPGANFPPAALSFAVWAVDIVAVLGALMGGAVSFTNARRIRIENEMRGITTSGERSRFLAQWGIFSNLCFLVAIIFNILVPIMVPPCAI